MEVKETVEERKKRWEEEKKERNRKVLVTNYLEVNAGVLCDNMDKAIEVSYGEVKKNFPLYKLLTDFLVENDPDAFDSIKKLVETDKEEHDKKIAYDVICDLVERDNAVNIDLETGKGKNLKVFREYVAACQNTLIKSADKKEVKPQRR